MQNPRERPNHSRSYRYIATGTILGLSGVGLYLAALATNNNTNAPIGLGLAGVGLGLTVCGNVLMERESVEFRARLYTQNESYP